MWHTSLCNTSFSHTLRTCGVARMWSWNEQLAHAIRGHHSKYSLENVNTAKLKRKDPHIWLPKWPSRCSFSDLAALYFEWFWSVNTFTCAGHVSMHFFRIGESWKSRHDFQASFPNQCNLLTSRMNSFALWMWYRDAHRITGNWKRSPFHHIECQCHFHSIRQSISVTSNSLLCTWCAHDDRLISNYRRERRWRPTRC